MTFVFRGIPKSLVDFGADGLTGVDVGRGKIDLWAIEGEEGSIVALSVGKTDLVSTDAFLERLVSC